MKKKILMWVKKNWLIALISLGVLFIFILIVFLIFWFEPIMSLVGLDPEKIIDAQWDIIRNLGYVAGALLLIIQITISNSRANALEKSAEAALASNVEARYHNAVSHLKEIEPFIRIGAIYNLYHISQSTDTYDATIFDIFCEYIKHDINAKEKQIIIDKLFRGNENNRVLKEPKNIDLTGADLRGINFSEAYLKGALLKGCKLDYCIFDKANLAEATLPANLDGISMKGVKLDDAKLFSGTDMKNVKLQPFALKNQSEQTSSLTNLKLWGIDLSDANLTGADLTGAKGLTFDQLSKVKCLHDVKGLDAKIEKELKDEKPELFNKLNSDSEVT